MSKVNEIKVNSVEEMVEVMLKLLKENNKPWQKSWLTINNNYKNYITNKPYSGGSNIVTLWLQTMLNPEILGQKRSNYYVTSKQAFDLGWKLKPECKNWSKDNDNRRQKIKKLEEALLKTSDFEERKRLKKEILELKEAIRLHSIWDEIVFYAQKYFKIVYKDEKYFKQELKYDSLTNEYIVTKEYEISKEYGEVHIKELNKVQSSLISKFYTIAPIEYFEGEKKIKGRNLDVTNYNTKKTFKELWDTLDSYCKNKKIKVVEKETNQAYYDILSDEITVPLISQFEKEELALDVWSHEVMHSTGAKNRLNRDLSGKSGSSKYAKEELVAEMGSLFFMLESDKLNEKILENKLSYIKAYLKNVRDNNDTNNLIYGINNGRKAFEYVVGADEDFGGEYE